MTAGGGPRVGVTAEQLFAPVPGGIGRYVAELARRLPALAAGAGPARGAVRFVVGRHPAAAVAAAGLDPELTTALAVPGRVAARSWVALRRPALPRRLLAGLDVVHATSAAVPPARGLPLVVTVHDLAFLHHPEAYPPAGRRWHERSARIAAAEAALLLTPSAATARDLTERYGVEPDRTLVTPLGADPVEPDLAGARAVLARLRVAGPYLLTVGTLEPRKNLARLLDAFAEAAPELGDHRLVVVGPSGWGPQPPPGAVGAAGRAALAGKVPDAVLHGLYALADGLAYPSLYEGFGLPVVEAMAHGVPVLTSDRSSLPEVAGDAALLVDPTDTAAIAAGLVRLAGDDGLRARLRAAGPPRAARFTWAATAEATWAAYARAAGKPAAAPAG
jgi:glycosyltransferase involved in cell wall biosynthesis